MRILFLCNSWAIAREPVRLVGTHPELRRGKHQWIRAVGRPTLLEASVSPRGSELSPEPPPRGSGTGAVRSAHCIEYDLRADTVLDIGARCPGGPPDLMIVWNPGYQALPPRIEEAPFPVVACFGDWPLVLPGQAGMLDTFDHLFTDRAGVRVLKQMGYENTEYWPLYAHDPDLFRVIPGVEKVWDIGLVGNLSPTVQRGRAPWLARVARLADRYRVRIAGGVFNEGCARIINATKITFNYTFKIPVNHTFDGCLNMRCYEAAACGSLLFCDEENEEIREFFEDRVHCVLYNEHNLEELFDYYLSHDEERERIAAAAVERAAELSLPRSLNQLAAHLEALDLPARVTGRRARKIPAPEQRVRHARQAAGAYGPGRSPAAALDYLREALATRDDDAAAHNDYAVVNFMLPTSGLENRREVTTLSLWHMRRARELCPESAFYALNLAQMLAGLERNGEALEQAQEALVLLDGRASLPDDPFCLPHPYGLSDYEVQYSILYGATRSAPESFDTLWRCLLLHRGGMLLGTLAEQQDQWQLAVIGYRVAVTARPDLGVGRAALARLLARHGDRAEALAQLSAGLQTDPWMLEAWTLYVDLLRDHGEEEAAREFLMGRLTMLEALMPPKELPHLQHVLAEYQQVREAMTEQLDDLAVAA
jgi:glycosyl transferase family 1